MMSVPVQHYDFANKSHIDILFEDQEKKYFQGSLSSIENYKKLKKCGTSDSVYKAEHLNTGEVVAIKKLVTEGKDNSNGISLEFYREINILQDIKHENIVLLKEIVVGRQLGNIFLVMEYCEEDLGRIIDKIQIPLSQDEIKNVMKQLFTGLRVLHENNIIHRDIKPTNLLVNQQGLLKIADFGISRSFSSNMSPKVGTLFYKSPEILFDFSNYTSAVDIWSAGCVLGELMKKSPLFPGKSEMDVISAIIDLLGTPNGNILPGFSESSITLNFNLKEQPYNFIHIRFKNSSENTISLLRHMLSYNPKLRPSVNECLDSSYFQENPAPCANMVLKANIFHKMEVIGIS